MGREGRIRCSYNESVQKETHCLMSGVGYESEHLEVRILRRVVIDMQNMLFADAIAEALRKFDSDFDPVMSESPDKTLELCNAILANILVMEVTAYAPWMLEGRMRIRDALKNSNPDCKVVLVVDEKKLADRVRQAKKDGLIDNFIYGSVSSSYLSAVIDAL